MPTSADELARAYDRYVAAFWRGETDEVRRFAAWLKGRWGLGGPPEPAGPPDAVSALGGAGASIRWYEADGMVFGYIPGVPHRCYQVRRDAEPPPLPTYGATSRRSCGDGRPTEGAPESDDADPPNGSGEAPASLM